jgi:hypothetical protein
MSEDRRDDENHDGNQLPNVLLVQKLDQKTSA